MTSVRRLLTGMLLVAVLGLGASLLVASDTPELTIVYSNNINGYVQPCRT
jgi:hypothetical protein